MENISSIALKLREEFEVTDGWTTPISLRGIKAKIYHSKNYKLLRSLQYLSYLVYIKILIAPKRRNKRKETIY